MSLTLDVGLDLGTPRYVGACAAMTAELLFAEGRTELAARLAACARADDATEYEMRVEIDRLVERGLTLPSPLPACDRDTVRTVLREVYGLDESG